MIERRRKPNPPRRSSNSNSPASSGPRCVISSRMRPMSDVSTRPSLAPYSQTPQIPHILFGRQNFPAQFVYATRHAPARRDRTSLLAVISRNVLVHQNRRLIQRQRTHDQSQTLLLIAGFDLRSPDVKLQTVVKVKPRLKLVLSRVAKKLVVNQPRTLVLIKCNRAPVRNRSGQSPVAVMFRDDLVIIPGRLPFQHARPGLVADDKRRVRVRRVLFLAVDLHG